MAATVAPERSQFRKKFAAVASGGHPPATRRSGIRRRPPGVRESIADESASTARARPNERLHRNASQSEAPLSGEAIRSVEFRAGSCAPNAKIARPSGGICACRRSGAGNLPVRFR